MARMLGVPVVHANFTGPNPGYSTLTFDREASGRYLGNSQVVDAEGKTVARLGTEQGVLLSEVAVGRQAVTETISDEFWLPEVTESHAAPMGDNWRDRQGLLPERNARQAPALK